MLDNKNLYNDKELIDEADLDWYDYGFRNYDPQIGRFTQLDPLTDDYPELTPYQYASCEPIGNVDVDGLESYQVLTPVIINLPKAAPVANAAANIFKISTRVLPTVSKLAAVHSEQSFINRQIQTNIQAQISPPSPSEQPTISQCCNYLVSAEQKSINADRTSDAGYNSDGTLKFSAKLTQNKTWNNFANNIVFSPAVDIAGAVVGIGELKGGLRLLNLSDFGIEFTKSNLVLGRRMHVAYKARLADNIQTFKEFTGIKGISQTLWILVQKRFMS